MDLDSLFYFLKDDTNLALSRFAELLQVHPSLGFPLFWAFRSNTIKLIRFAGCFRFNDFQVTSFGYLNEW